jgi:hypothetical protein
MKNLIIENGSDTPKIILNKDDGKLEFSGYSLSDNVTVFYTPILEWIDEYVSDPQIVTTLVIKFKYLNSASQRILMDIIMKFDQIKESGCLVDVVWCYPNDDDDMRTLGEDYSELSNIPFQFIELNKNAMTLYNN